MLLDRLLFFSLAAFLPKYLSDLGFSAISSGMMLSILTLSGAFGGLIGGIISDNIGRKSVIAGSLACSTPFLFIFQATGGWLAGLWLFFAGAFILASFSVTVVAAQEIMPDNKAMASSLALGFGLGLGGLGVGLLGHIATAIGLEHTVLLIAFLPLVASALSLGLPGKAEARVRNF
ncbi:MAG: MFS transporter [Actinomycetota bacterium]